MLHTNLQSYTYRSHTACHFDGMSNVEKIAMGAAVMSAMTHTTPISTLEHL